MRRIVVNALAAQQVSHVSFDVSLRSRKERKLTNSPSTRDMVDAGRHGVKDAFDHAATDATHVAGLVKEIQKVS